MAVFGSLSNLVRAATPVVGGAMAGAQAAEQERYRRAQIAAEQRRRDEMVAWQQQQAMAPQGPQSDYDRWKADPEGFKSYLLAREIPNPAAAAPAPYDPNTDPEVQQELAMRQRGIGRYWQAPQAAGGAGAGPGVTKPVATSEGERKNVGFYERAKSVSADLDRLPPLPVMDSLKRMITPKAFEGSVLSGHGQERRVAELAFLTAVLRKDSGATITPSEEELGEQQFFDRQGDTEATRAMKRRNRQTAIRELQLAAGRAMPQAGAAASAPSAAPAAEKPISLDAWQALQDAGYSDEEIFAQGYVRE